MNLETSLPARTSPARNLTPAPVKGGPRLLVVDDERPIRRLLQTSLGGQYTVFEAATGEEALQVAATRRPEAILLDLGLPDMDGLEVTRRLREWTQVPIIIISVREQEEDKVAVLDAGADDYLIKPFSISELSVRLRVALRHSLTPEVEPVYHYGELTVDFARRLVTVNNRPVSLTPTEYDILRVLVQHAGKVLTHRHLIQMIWGRDEDVSLGHLLRVNVSNLRRKIEPDPYRPHYVTTEPGVGYRLHDFHTGEFNS